MLNTRHVIAYGLTQDPWNPGLRRCREASRWYLSSLRYRLSRCGCGTREADNLELERTEQLSAEATDAVVKGHLDYLASRAVSLPHRARVLDFGCGIGASVRSLLAMGFDAWGVDVLASWGEDYGIYWHHAQRPPAEVVSRLFQIDSQSYRLPFDDDSFDFCFSDQVFEHVQNPAIAFRELARVLKPGALSVHRFPGPNSPVEAHIGVPIIPLCRYRWYLAIWAVLGLRSSRQRGFTWRETLQSNVEMMNQCSYPTRGRLRRIAKDAGVRIAFDAGGGVVHNHIGRAGRIVRGAQRIGMGAIMKPLVSLISQRYMIVYGR